jgi:hypothetical protein
MPHAEPLLHRQKLPPPITMAVSTPRSERLNLSGDGFGHTDVKAESRGPRQRFT